MFYLSTVLRQHLGFDFVYDMTIPNKKKIVNEARLQSTAPPTAPICSNSCSDWTPMTASMCDDVLDELKNGRPGLLMKSYVSVIKSVDHNEVFLAAFTHQGGDTYGADAVYTSRDIDELLAAEQPDHLALSPIDRHLDVCICEFARKGICLSDSIPL